MLYDPFVVSKREWIMWFVEYEYLGFIVNK